jgi:AGZA family xanthine/uracil permease-like MFS transporter
MLRNVTDINWSRAEYSIPAGMTILIMPLTFSIAWGIAAGIITFPIVMAAKGRASEVHAGQWALAAAFVIYFIVRTGGVL